MRRPARREDARSANRLTIASPGPCWNQAATSASSRRSEPADSAPASVLPPAPVLERDPLAEDRLSGLRDRELHFEGVPAGQEPSAGTVERDLDDLALTGRQRHRATPEGRELRP